MPHNVFSHATICVRQPPAEVSNSEISAFFLPPKLKQRRESHCVVVVVMVHDMFDVLHTPLKSKHVEQVQFVSQQS